MKSLVIVFRHSDTTEIERGEIEIAALFPCRSRLLEPLDSQRKIALHALPLKICRAEIRHRGGAPVLRAFLKPVGSFLEIAAHSASLLIDNAEIVLRHSISAGGKPLKTLGIDKLILRHSHESREQCNYNCQDLFHKTIVKVFIARKLTNFPANAKTAGRRLPFRRFCRR